MIPLGEFLLSHSKSTPQGLNPRHTPRCSQLFWRHRARIGVRGGRGRNFLLRHGTHWRFRERPLAAVVEDFDNRAVRPNFRGSSGFVHVALPVGLK